MTPASTASGPHSATHALAISLIKRADSPFATLPRAKRMTGVPTCDGLDGRDGLDDDDPSDFLRVPPSEDEKDSKRPIIGEAQD